MRPKIPIAERFWTKVNKTETCWLWTAALDSHGYGHILPEGKGSNLAHRVSYELVYGVIPEGLDILHKCDNPPCVRPDHLIPGTHNANMLDRNTKGRNARGERHARSRLTISQIQEIRARREAGETLRAIGKDFNATVSHISQITHHNLWKSVP